MLTRFMIACALALPFMISTSPAHATTPPGKPGIRIVSPANGTTIHGSTVTIKVDVSNFKLVKPVLLDPSKWSTIPLLEGNQGHIHYVLDNLSNLVLTQDVVTSTSHTWTNVSPGRHTLIAYLATSQHAPFPGVPTASIHVTVVPAASSAHPASLAIPAITSVHAMTVKRGNGSSIVVSVKVANFKLVDPSMKNPQLLKGNQGHIHYVLDNMSSFIAGRDAVSSLTHPWTSVAPGHHTVTVYLVNSLHQVFPGTKPVSVSISVPKTGSTGGKTQLLIGGLPSTGGAGTARSLIDQSAQNRALLTIALGLMLMGGAFLRRRIASQ